MNRLWVLLHMRNSNIKKLGVYLESAGEWAGREGVPAYFDPVQVGFYTSFWVETQMSSITTVATDVEVQNASFCFEGRWGMQL